MAKPGPKKGSRRRRIRARVRRVRKRVGKGVKSQWGKISSLAGGVVFLTQLTEKDRLNGDYTGRSKGEQAKVLVNNILGRITGFNPFNDGSIPTYEQTMNIDGIFNKWSALGAGLWLYSKIPIKGKPKSGKAGTLGKAILTGAVIGGFFDAKDTSSTSHSQFIRQSPIAVRSGNTNVITVSTI